MKKLLFIGTLILMIWACANSTSEQEEEEGASSSPLSLSGKQVYEQFCILCHGADGKMALGGAFDLTTSTLPLEDRIALVREGRNTMNPFEGLLSEAEIKAVAEYSLSFYEGSEELSK